MVYEYYHAHTESNGLQSDLEKCVLQLKLSFENG